MVFRYLFQLYGFTENIKIIKLKSTLCSGQALYNWNVGAEDAVLK